MHRPTSDLIESRKASVVIPSPTTAGRGISIARSSTSVRLRFLGAKETRLGKTGSQKRDVASTGLNSPAGRRRLLRRPLRLGEHVFAGIGLVLVLYHCGFDLSRMVSGSMSPTLQGTGRDDGDWVLSEKLSYRLRDPHRWELVEFTNTDGVQVMKRVVGLPGEAVSLKERQVAVNGAVAPRPASLREVEYWTYGNLYGGRSVECGGGYYVLGDDSKDSQDSRYEGPVSPDHIIGRPWLIVWPPSRIGFVNP